MRRILPTACICVSCFAPAIAQEEAAAPLSLLGDLRGGYYGANEDDRDGSKDTKGQLLGRARIGAQWNPSDYLSLEGRVAGRYSSRDNDYHFKLYDHIPDIDGLLPGQSTVDELFVSLKPGEKWRIDLGRLQTAFELEGVAGGSLDRSDSPNTDITWTDGAHARYQAPAGWKAHLIVQRNVAEGPTNVRLPPLSFQDQDSRLTYFTAVENKETWGPIVQRGLDVSYLPSTLDADGVPSTKAEDYWAVVGRLAAQWRLGESDLKLLIGSEIGYAPNTPQRSVTGTGASGDAGGMAWQVQTSFIDVFPGHSFALQHGRADDGWLISPDFRSNEILSEARYEWKISPKQTFAARYRLRDDKEQLIGTVRKRSDQDFFFRYTVKFQQ